MFFSALASPAEAGFALGSGLWPARAQAPAGNRFPPRIKSRTSFSGSCATRCGRRARRRPGGKITAEPRAEADHAEALAGAERLTLAREADDTARQQAGDLHHRH